MRLTDNFFQLLLKTNSPVGYDFSGQRPSTRKFRFVFWFIFCQGKHVMKNQTYGRFIRS